MTRRAWTTAPLTYHVAARENDPDGAAAYALAQVPRRLIRPTVISCRAVAHDPSISDYPTTYRVDICAVQTGSDRWTLYGLPGGYTTAWNADDERVRHLYRDRHAVPLVTFRATPSQMPARVNAARGWALYAYDLVP